MQILNYLLLLFFINFCNSFSINKKYTPFITKKNNLKLNMGCDYYIDDSLYIFYSNDKELTYINLEKSKGYYTDYIFLDIEDAPDYDYKTYKKETLEPSMKPIIIFMNNTFSKLSFENKYKELIDYELKICNKTWDNVNKIIKKEERYER